MVTGWWFMPQGSCLKAHGSWPRKVWRWPPPGPGLSAKISWPWAMGLQPRALRHEPWALSHLFVHFFISWISSFLSFQSFNVSKFQRFKAPKSQSFKVQTSSKVQHLKFPSQQNPNFENLGTHTHTYTHLFQTFRFFLLRFWGFPS